MRSNTQSAANLFHVIVLDEKSFLIEKRKKKGTEKKGQKGEGKNLKKIPDVRGLQS